MSGTAVMWPFTGVGGGGWTGWALAEGVGPFFFFFAAAAAAAEVVGEIENEIRIAKTGFVTWLDGGGRVAETIASR